MKPRILYVITRAEMGGGQTHVADLMDGFRHFMDVHLVTGERGYLTEAAEAMGAGVHVIPSLVHPMNPIKDTAATMALASRFGRLRPALVHAHTSKAGLLARMAAAVRGTPSVFTAHTWCFAEGTSKLWHAIGTPLERAASRLCRKIITVSEANRALAIEQGIPAGKIQTVHNGIADSPERAVPESDSGPIRILMAARFVRQKDHATLLKAAATLNRPVEVLLAGDGPLRGSMERLAAELGVGASLRFLGDRRDVNRLLASAHIFALPSRWEGFPISILEAMRAGLPVIASDVGGVREAVTASTGFVVKPGDDGDFAEKLGALVQSPELRGRLGRAARISYERNFTRKTMIERTLAVYRESVAASRNPVPEGWPS